MARATTRAIDRPLPRRGRGASRWSASTCSRRSAGACCPTASGGEFAEIQNVVGHQDRAVQPLPDARRGPGRGRGRARRHRALHGQRRQHRARPADAVPACRSSGEPVERRIVGGLLGQWAVWTRRAVELLETCRALRRTSTFRANCWRRRAAEITDATRRSSTSAHGFAGCIAGHPRGPAAAGAARRHLVPRSGRVSRARARPRRSTGYGGSIPHLNDDAFVAEHRDEWLDG